MVIFMNDANVFVTHSACVTRGYAEKGRVGFAGFTLIELLVVLAIIAMLISVAMPRYFQSIDVAKETTLAENLRATRETIDKFYGDTGQYPESLDQLKEKNYLRAVPVDPVTESAQTWIIVPPQAGVKGKVFNIRSGATGNNRLGQPFADM
jgi:general secretion pathway protein G